MPRFISWLAIGLASAFLLVVSTSFSLSAIAALGFAISIGTLVVSAAIAVNCHRHAASALTGAISAIVSAWTIVASLVFSQSAFQHLALAGSLAVGGLAVVGLTIHELTAERAVHSIGDATVDERESRLAAAA
jgi:hypothetical protein